MEEKRDNILDNLEELISKEAIIDKDGVVSAYTVYKALQRYFENVFFSAYDNYNLVSKINSLYTKKEIRDSRRKGFDSPYLKVLDIRSNIYNINRDRNEIQVTFIPFGPENKGYGSRKNVLYKRKDDEVIYTKYKEMPNFCDKVWEECHEDIDNIFDICNSHSRLKEFFKDGNREYALLLKYNDFMAKITFDYLGNVKYRVLLNNEIREIGVKTHSEIIHLLNDNERLLMERIPVNVEELSLLFQDILNEDMVKRGNVRVRKM